jgi:hypothetical protein
MATLDGRYLGVGTQHVHKRWTGATTAATLVAAPGTGFTICPVRFRWCGTVVASLFLTATSGGGSFFRTSFLINGVNQETAWWDTLLPSNQPITLECATDPGAAEFDIWFIVVRGGAGAGALVQ